MLSDHNGIKLKFHNRKIAEKSPNIWKINNIPLYYICMNPKKSQEIKGIKQEGYSKISI